MNKSLNRKDLLHVGIEALLASLGVFGSLLCLCSAFEIPFPSALWALIPLLVFGVCLLSRVKRGWLVCLILGLAFLLACVLLRKPLLRSGRAIWNVLAFRYGKGYAMSFGAYNEKLGLRYGSAAKFLYPLAFLESYFAALAVSRWKNTAVCAIVLLPGIIPCFILTDTPPKFLYLVLVVFTLLIQLFTQNVRRREARETGKAVLWAVGISALLLGALLLIFPKNRYKPPATWERLSRKLQQLTASWESRDAQQGQGGTPEGIRLRELSALPGSERPLMTVVTDFHGTLYLCGSIYEGFDGDSWTRLTDRPWPAEVVFPSLKDGDLHASDTYVIEGDMIYNRSFTLTVTPNGKLPVCYFPANPLTLPEKSKLISDAYLQNLAPEEAYTMSFTSYTNAVVSDPNYDSYVRETCLQLPSEETAAALRGWLAAHAAEIYGSPVDPAELPVAERAELISKAVSNCAAYSRDAVIIPAGRDFSLWFLEEGEHGYCVHYATAAAALLRACGIPARYLSGFVCEAKGSGKISLTVSDLQAHAWVEYYDGGCWKMLEPTPGNATEFTGVIPPTETEPPIEVPTVRPTRPRPTEPPETDPSEPVETDETLPPEPPTAETEPPAAPTVRRPWRFPVKLLWALIPFAIVGLFWLHRRLALLWQAEQLRLADNNKKAILLYRRCARLNRISHAGNAAEVEAIGKKAAFSQHQITDEEVTVMEKGFFLAAARVRRSGRFKRFCYQYIVPLF